ncbi:MAG: hypothetical protein K8R23_02630 [Chthoniobacter sp.]|nr:hypothetical protein [Chthoniobacter sp.]
MKSSNLHSVIACSPVQLRIVGSGHFLPPGVVTATEIDARIGRNQGWTLKQTGVETRHHVGAETAAQMGAAALRAALAGEDERPDLLLGASGTPQQPIPCTAALIAAEMGWSGVPCFDVNATCLSFLSALQVVGGLIAAGNYRRIAIVSAEIASKGLNWQQPEAAALMGDGAAAVLIEAGESRDSALLGSLIETWPEGAAFTEIRGGGSRLPATAFRPEENASDFQFHMDGPAVFRLAAEKIESFVARLVGAASTRWDSIDWVIPHQASLPGIRHLRRRLRIPAAKLIETVQHQGNVIAASIPLALHEAITSGRLQRGQTVLFLGTSAGFSLGGALLRY